MRQRFGELMEVVKRDNRAVIAAMIAEGQDVPETMGELGLTYVPEQHRQDDRGEPVMHVYGMRDMVARRTFSCGDAAAYEAAIVEEKYGVPTLCVAVAQGDNDFHAVFVTIDDAVDPTANFLAGKRVPIPMADDPLPASACRIEDGRVVCVEEEVCSVDDRGTWHCDPVPGLSGRRTNLRKIQRTRNGSAWGQTKEGAVVPVRRGR